MAVGRPTKLTDKILSKIQSLASKGFTDKEISDILDISKSTLNLWKNKHPEFSDSLKAWKLNADAEVERSLYERACGYSHNEDKIFNNNGEALVVPTVKHYPPDPTSMIFWLKNRQPKEWRDRVEHNVDVDSSNLTDEEIDNKIKSFLNKRKSNGSDS